ncbi:MAG: LPXTG cell wall anchor domain-containing protein [Lactococcus lactis]
MIKKIIVLILALFMVSGLHSKVKAETSSSQANSQITLHVENKGSIPSSSRPSNSESQKNKKTPTSNLPLTNAQRETGLLVGGLLLLLGLTCLVVKRKRGAEHA